jgi:hypothetical protein
MLIVLLFAFAGWAEVFSHMVPIGVIAGFLGLLIAMTSFPLTYLFLRRCTARWHVTGLCPECRNPLVAAGGGFIDGAPPTRDELLMYLSISPDISPDFVARGGRVRFFRVFTVRAGRRCVEIMYRGNWA